MHETTSLEILIFNPQTQIHIQYNYYLGILQRQNNCAEIII